MHSMARESFAQRILRFLQSESYRPAEIDDVAEAMGIGEEEQGDFHDACRALMRTGRVVLGSKNALALPPLKGKVVGTFRGNQRGFGFIVPDTPNAHGDLYVPPEATGGAMTGDTVRAQVAKRGKRGGKMLYQGKVVEIIRRGQSRIVGELHNQQGQWLVVPEGNAVHLPVVVDDARAKRARPHDQVVVEITEYPTGRTPARGVIVKVLGPHGRPDVDTRSIIEQYQLPVDFPEPVLQAARRAVADYDPRAEAVHREDLSQLTIITIDPKDAKDFDDAISLTKGSDGTVELGVHIADVSHFVPAGGALDREASDRSNSVYLPGTVIPMLPEVLSNGVCSLQERQPRLTKSAFIRFDDRGRVKSARFANTMIRSTKRLTYEQASAVLEGKTGRLSAKVVALLKNMEKLARAIRDRRLSEGTLELDLPEVELVHDEDGRVMGVTPADLSFSHKIIEMFMVEANEAVARLLSDIGVPYLRRIHDEPKDLSDGALQKFVRPLGHDLPKSPDRFALQALLDAVRGQPDAFAVHLAVLRSMHQAEYAPLAIGHYALASEHYCHFTSPIRRYPDLTIHRLVDRYIEGALTARHIPDDLPGEEELFELGGKCSANERRAESAERELRLVLILRLLESRIGDELEGIVTGVANVGVFVQLEPYLVDGLLRFDRLPDDWWEVDSTRGAVVGQRSGRRIRIGDKLRVAIARIHIPTRRLDLDLVEPGRGRKSEPGDDRPRARTRRGRPESTKPQRARRGARVPATKRRRVRKQ